MLLFELIAINVEIVQQGFEHADSGIFFVNGNFTLPVRLSIAASLRLTSR